MRRRLVLVSALLLAGVALSACASEVEAPAPKTPIGGLSSPHTPARTSPGGAGASAKVTVSPLRKPDGPPVAVPTPGGSGGFVKWLLIGLALAFGVIVAGVVAVIQIAGRRSSAPGLPGVPYPASAAFIPAAPPPGNSQRPSSPAGTGSPPVALPDGRAVLARSLREVSAGGASQAISQQIERLLSEGEPDRDALVASCVRFRDQLSERFPQLADTLRAALAAAGVHEVRADGQRFDGRVHEAVDTAPTADPGLHDLVAQTLRCGYVDGDRVVRVPRVVVYRLEQDVPS